jgi:hypothetical protein
LIKFKPFNCQPCGRRSSFVDAIKRHQKII